MKNVPQIKPMSLTIGIHHTLNMDQTFVRGTTTLQIYLYVKSSLACQWQILLKPFGIMCPNFSSRVDFFFLWGMILDYTKEH